MALQFNYSLRVWSHKKVLQLLTDICSQILPRKEAEGIGSLVTMNCLSDGEQFEAGGFTMQCFDIHSTKERQFGFTALLPDCQRICCLGDEPFSPQCKQYAEDADWLMSEAFCLYGDRERFLPYEKHHSTVLDAARLAEELGVKNLILYHTEDRTLDTRCQRYMAEAKAEEFEKLGATVCVIDKQQGNHFVGDLADKQVLEQFAKDVIEKHGHVDYLINNALPLMKGINECSYEEFQYALSVGVTAPFYLTKLFAPHFAKGAAIVNISSSRDRMSQPQTESYTAAKGGIAALTHALAVSLAGKVRVNSISPGWIDTAYTIYEGSNAIQQPAGRVGNPLDIANMVLFLCSEKAGFITGENICIDGGMTRQMIYHGDNGWTLKLNRQ